MIAVQFNGFLLKAFLWIPTHHWCNPVRLIVIALGWVPGLKESYPFDVKKDTAIGHIFSKLSLGLLALDLLVIAKAAALTYGPGKGEVG